MNDGKRDLRKRGGLSGRWRRILLYPADEGISLSREMEILRQLVGRGSLSTGYGLSLIQICLAPKSQVAPTPFNQDNPRIKSSSCLDTRYLTSNSKSPSLHGSKISPSIKIFDPFAAMTICFDGFRSVGQIILYGIKDICEPESTIACTG